MNVELIAGWTDPEEVIGTLKIERSHGRENSSVSLDPDWIRDHGSLFLDPDLLPYQGTQYPPNDKTTFGFLSDASPDRWGRKLMLREERNMADREHRSIRTLMESDYLLGVSDALRYGGLRFRDSSGQYDSNRETPIPPIAKLRMLESAARQYEMTGNDEKALQILLDPGSSLGGARPKANVIDPDGTLWIAKFPSKKDDTDVGAWEIVEHDLARDCGLDVPEAKLLRLSLYGSTFLSRRFDREGGKRIHLMSFMTALGKTDGQTDGVGYIDLAAQLEAVSASPDQDLLELWKRMAFNILTSNCDDHLRNHGLILRKDGWHLSPAYDLNPTTEKDALSLLITEDDNRKSIHNAIRMAEFFRLSEWEAAELAESMQETIRNSWMDYAHRYGLPEREIRDMAPAFSECETELMREDEYER